MNKIKYIIRREYLVRIRKRSFWILTVIGPVLYAFLIALPVITKSGMKPDVQSIYVVDKSTLFGSFESSEELKFYYQEPDEEEAIKKLLKVQESSHLLIIPEIDIDDPKGFRLISGKNAGLQFITIIESKISNRIRDLRINKFGISKEVLDSLEPSIDVNPVNLSGEKNNARAASGIAWIAGFLIYFFIFMYGSLVLRGVQEEKSNRIIEIMVSAVRPFELMFGKIVGIALIGLTQFFLWILLTMIFSVTIVSIVGSSGFNPLPDSGLDGIGIEKILSLFEGINFLFIIGIFIFYFIGGYLLYSSLFASVAAAVDNQTDMQQFMLPISIPLIISIVFISFVTEAPHSSLSIWLSMIPFTSPIIMMGRIAFGVPVHELIISMVLLVLGFIFTTWLASKIYRVGILMYGKKVNYRELAKWIFYK